MSAEACWSSASSRFTFLAECERLGFPPQHGEFGAYMQVESVNDGPVTLIVDTKDLK